MLLLKLRMRGKAHLEEAHHAVELRLGRVEDVGEDLHGLRAARRRRCEQHLVC